MRGKRPIDVAENCGIQKGNLSRYLNGKLPTPKIETVSRIAKYLDVNVFWLLGYADNSTKESRAISNLQISKIVGIEINEDDVAKQGLLDDITNLCSNQDLETLRNIYTVVKALAK